LAAGLLTVSFLISPFVMIQDDDRQLQLKLFPLGEADSNVRTVEEGEIARDEQTYIRSNWSVDSTVRTVQEGKEAQNGQTRSESSTDTI
jgi:hypothetical protein